MSLRVLLQAFIVRITLSRAAPGLHFGPLFPQSWSREHIM